VSPTILPFDKNIFLMIEGAFLILNGKEIKNAVKVCLLFPNRKYG